MLFWIIIGVIMLVAIAGAIFMWRGKYVADGFSVLGLGLIITIFVAGVYTMTVGSLVGTTGYTTAKTELQALKTDSEIGGRSYFLSGGYVNQDRVFNYITKDEQGAIRLSSISTDSAVIYEGDDDPRMETYHFYSESFLLPWKVERWVDSYAFYVPTGSVLTDEYAIDNN